MDGRISKMRADNKANIIDAFVEMMEMIQRRKDLLCLIAWHLTRHATF